MSCTCCGLQAPSSSPVAKGHGTGNLAEFATGGDVAVADAGVKHAGHAGDDAVGLVGNRVNHLGHQITHLQHLARLRPQTPPRRVPVACSVSEPASGVAWHSGAGTAGGLRRSPARRCAAASSRWPGHPACAQAWLTSSSPRNSMVVLQQPCGSGASMPAGFERVSQLPPGAGQAFVNRAVARILGQQNGFGCPESGPVAPSVASRLLRCRSAARLRSRNAGPACSRHHAPAAAGCGAGFAARWSGVQCFR